MGIGELMDKYNLEPTEFCLIKIQQIYEMILVRHGFMLVGMQLGGKSVDYQILAEALTIMSDQVDNEEIMPVEYRIINPKSISMGQLYGCFDPVSHEWSDGVLAINYREQANLCNVKDFRQWLVFDGPVDAVWIENMNTVLDDNKKLCLMSGEIIQMGGTMSMMFETSDLEQASPATVSRCGMIYIEPYQLGWQPLVSCYMNTVPEKMPKADRAVLKDLFYWCFEACFEWLIRAKFMMVTSNQHLAKSHLTMFNCMLDEWAEDAPALTPAQNTNYMVGSFLLPLVWSLGATLNADYRPHFDKFLRQLLTDQVAEFPMPKTIKFSKQTQFPSPSLFTITATSKRAVAAGNTG